MPNRKIKHIVAKLVGAATEETLDVYDVDAIHTDKIANNLTTTDSDYVLGASQGKVLNDSISESIGDLKTPIASYSASRSYSFADNWRIAYITVIGSVDNVIYRAETTILRLDIADAMYYHYIGAYLTASNNFGASVVIRPTSAELIGAYRNGNAIPTANTSMVLRLYN